MIDKLLEVWTSRDYPVLVEVARRKDAGAPFVEVSEVATALNMDPARVLRAAATLKRRGLVDMGVSLGTEFDTFDEISGEAYLRTTETRCHHRRRTRNYRERHGQNGSPAPAEPSQPHLWLRP